MKKILLLAHASGEKEDFAARNLANALKRSGGREVRVEIADLLQPERGPFGLPGRAGLARWREALWDLLRVEEPDLVVFTSPLYGILLEEIYRAGRARDFSLIALATAPAMIPAAWAHLPADFFAVAGEAAAEKLMEAGVPKKKIKVFGFPMSSLSRGNISADSVATAFYNADEPRRILYLLNCARRKAPKLLDRLLEETDWRLTVCLDDAEEIAEIVRAMTGANPERLKIIEGAPNLPLLLRRHAVVITRVSTDILQEAIAARCPVIVPKPGSGREEENLAALQRAHAGALAEKPREVVAWLKRAYADEGKLLALWRKNLEQLGDEDGEGALAPFVLKEAQRASGLASVELRALPPPVVDDADNEAAVVHPGAGSRAKKLLLCDLHSHTTWSDGKLSVREIVDFYGQRGFDCLCVTDHLSDPKRLLGKLVNFTGLVIPPGEIADYFAAIEREKKRAWAKYDLLLMTGIEFNKDGYTPKTSAHLLGVDLKQPINPSLSIEEIIREIHAQDALAIASHPHETKGHWGKDTLYFWEHVEQYAPLLDAWEVANRDDIFNPVGLKKLPFIASSDFHKPKHIHSWKTLLYCEKEAEAIKHCIRVNRDVSLTLYRDHRFGLDERSPLPPLDESESQERSLVARI